MARKRTVTRVEIARSVILGGIALIVIVFLGYCFLYIFGVIGSQKSELYLTLEDRELKNDPIEVIELFSYTCPHCQRLDVSILKWAHGLPDDVSFRQIHMNNSVQTEVLSTVHLVLVEDDMHDQLNGFVFREFNQNPTTFARPESIADLLEVHGMDRDRFLSLYRSSRIATKRDQESELAKEFGIPIVPYFVIANRFTVSAEQTFRETIDKVNKVIEMVRSGELSEETESEPIETDTEGASTDPSDSGTGDESVDPGEMDPGIESTDASEETQPDEEQVTEPN